MIPNTRTRNFTLSEVIHRPHDFPLTLLPIAYTAMGYVQALRDQAWEYFGREIGFDIGSGYRSPAYNKSLKNASPNSFHIWRFDGKGGVVFALDLRHTDKHIKPITLEDFYSFLKDRVRGETYIHTAMGFVHIAPVGADEEWRAA